MLRATYEVIILHPASKRKKNYAKLRVIYSQVFLVKLSLSNDFPLLHLSLDDQKFLTVVSYTIEDLISNSTPKAQKLEKNSKKLEKTRKCLSFFEFLQILDSKKLEKYSKYSSLNIQFQVSSRVEFESQT